MKYIKQYDNVSSTPQIGDYVIINLDNHFNYHKDFVNLIINNIGQVTYISLERNVNYYTVVFPNKQKFDFTIGEIKEYAPNTEELELKLSQNKFNL